ncbi:MAG: ABC transporter permease [Sedimentisphaerales bacterium]|nr:ABC transporter permease [Sedimentisphaerales bacterium]
MLKLFFWFRYLCKRRIVFLSVAAVALSVSLLIVVASLFTGFIAAFERSAVDAVGDIMIAAPEGVTFDKYPELIRRLEQTDIVEAACATLSCDGLLHVGKGNVRGVRVWGIEPDRQARVTNLKDALIRQRQMPGVPSFDVPGMPGKVGGFIGIGMAADPNEQTDEYDQQAVLDAMVGQQVLVTTGTVSQLPEGTGEPRRVLVPFSIADVAFTGVYQLDESLVYVPIRTLQEALYPDEKGSVASSVSVKLRPNVNPDLAVVQIRGLWRVFAEDELGWTSYLITATSGRIRTAREMQHQFVVEVRKQMGVLLLVFGVISFSVVVLVFCIFYMIVRLKRKDVGIMKSCGASSTSVAWIFLGFGITVGVMGAGLGAALGYLITVNINFIEGWIRATFGLKLWQSSVYMFSRIPNVVDWQWAMILAGFSIAAAALGALLPAFLAARTRPVEVLRYE